MSQKTAQQLAEEIAQQRREIQGARNGYLAMNLLDRRTVDTHWATLTQTQPGCSAWRDAFLRMHQALKREGQPYIYSFVLLRSLTLNWNEALAFQNSRLSAKQQKQMKIVWERIARNPTPWTDVTWNADVAYLERKFSAVRLDHVRGLLRGILPQDLSSFGVESPQGGAKTDQPGQRASQGWSSSSSTKEGADFTTGPDGMSFSTSFKASTGAKIVWGAAARMAESFAASPTGRNASFLGRFARAKFNKMFGNGDS